MGQTETSTEGRHQAHVDTPLVSVIVPAYNVTEFIRDALDSALAQTFKDYGIIVVNDGSPDTAELERALEPYRASIVYLKQENRGLSGARNTAIRASKGSFIALLDADDMWLPNYLEVQVERMQADPTLDVLYPNALIFGDALEAGREFMDVCPSRGEVTFESLVTQQCTVMICSMMRRETVLNAGLFDESLRSSEDFDLWLR
ncbi:MAG TPA: glycosyltransferase family A protein, partial [Pyrinomonadaceae bacterium]|nr:glycosyltransferase family A protein [Pyrinomonadaceae bacterium]